MNILKSLIIVPLLAIGLWSQQPSGYEIMQQVLKETDWQDMKANMQLTLRNNRGEERIREISFFSKKNSKTGEDQMLMRFIAPADVKGTSFLTIEHEDGDDEQYLYLPALRKVKRIVASGKGGYFMSSDFTYYDIGKPELNDWKYSRMQDTELDGVPCYVIECLPANEQIKEDTGYGKIIRYVDKKEITVIKSDYFDKNGDYLKVMKTTERKRIKNTWFATRMEAFNQQIEHTSIMQFNDISVDVGLKDNMFSVRMLQRR